MPVRRRPRDARARDRADRSRLARLPARRAAGAALRLPRPRAVRARRTATASTRTRCARSLRARRSAGDVQWNDALFGYQHRRRRRRPVVRRARQRRRRAAGRRRRHRVHLGRRPAAAHAVAQDAHLRAARQGLHRCGIPTCPSSCAAPTPGWRAGRRSSTCATLGVTAVELLPVHHSRRRPAPASSAG